MTPLEKLRSLEAKLDEAKKEYIKAEQQLRKISREKLDAIPPEYSYTVYSDEGNNSFHIFRLLVNTNDYQAIIKEYGYPTFSGIEKNEKVISVEYYRKNGIVTHRSGGWLLLDDPFACDDAEWDNLMLGVTRGQLR